MTTTVATRKGGIVQDPPLVQRLLSDPRAGWLWFFLRIWLGWQWITASEHKIFDPKWVQTGVALKGYWVNAITANAAGKTAVTFDWYKNFLQLLINTQSYTWFAKLIAYGELLVGIGLIIGAFTGIAAFFGALMNWNFMMAGSASTNPLLFVIAVALVLAWKVAGYIGADYFLLKFLGTPWRSKQVAPSEVTQS